MLKLLNIALAATAIVLAPAAAFGQSISGQDLTPEGQGAYFAFASAIDTYEIRSAELAMQKAERPEVQAFARTMLEEHRNSRDRLAEVARSSGMEVLEPAMRPVHWELLRRLERSRGARFDRRYVDQQVETHEIAVELHRNFAENGSSAPLRAYAEATAPIAWRHLEQARQLDQ